MKILQLRPRKIAGFMIRCSDWGHAHRLLTDINSLMEARQ